MESNWRWNVEDLGLGGPGELVSTGLFPGYGHVTLAAKLVTPFTLFGTEYNWLLQATVNGVPRRWCYAGLLAKWPFATIFSWQAPPSGFPFGVAVHTDGTGVIP